MMTDTDYEELKRVCRIRGVPEPTEPTAEAFCEAQRELTRRELKVLAEKIGRDGLTVGGRGFAIPSALLAE